MLVPLESYFRDALKAALPADIEVRSGPGLGPPHRGVTALVEVSALELRLTPPPDEDPTAGHEAAFHREVHRWSADGQQRDFTLPASARGRIVEVESPPGHALTLGDDYLLEGDTVRCYQPPAQAGLAVVAFLRGEPARGFLERRPCESTLVVKAWGQVPGAADTLLSSALAAVQIASVDLGNLEEVDSHAAGPRLRLLRPRLSLLGLARGAELLHDTPFSHAQARFLVRGLFEQLVAVGEPEPTGIIREVRRV